MAQKTTTDFIVDVDISFPLQMDILDDDAEGRLKQKDSS